MAACLLFEELVSSGRPAVSSPSGLTFMPFLVSQAEVTNGVFSCPAGSHLVMTVQEANGLPKPGVPDAALMRETFFLSFGLVMTFWLVAKGAGAVLRLIRGEDSEFS